ncbi:hypothetical protein ACIHCQ_10080 [Streptomyces sp. NPDC052236]|uniref:hypothetical protein n=1 Tax=Streptomyces sp. NPDC052236 TaxID=3365686 RepID=UPI0037D94F57
MRTHIRRGTAVAVAVSALFLTAACGGSDSSSDDDKKPTGTASEAKDTAAEAPADGAPLTAAQLKAATLEVADLPADWKAKTVPVEDLQEPKADKPACQPIVSLFATKVVGATMGKDADFKFKESDDASLSESVFTFPGTGAADFTKAIGTALASCPDVAFTQDGEKATFKLEKLSIPTVAEESHAFRMSMDMGEVGTYRLDILVAHQGTGAIRAAYIPTPTNPIDKPDTPAKVNPFDDLAKRMGDKLVKGAKS